VRELTPQDARRDSNGGLSAGGRADVSGTAATTMAATRTRSQSDTKQQPAGGVHVAAAGRPERARGVANTDARIHAGGAARPPTVIDTRRRPTSVAVDLRPAELINPPSGRA
jgi:hypothetical protein